HEDYFKTLASAGHTPGFYPGNVTAGEHQRRWRIAQSKCHPRHQIKPYGTVDSKNEYGKQKLNSKHQGLVGLRYHNQFLLVQHRREVETDWLGFIGQRLAPHR